ncbi:MAG: hypothetical protein ACRD16_00995 [Thermoanaerobaculia bacterium]
MLVSELQTLHGAYIRLTERFKALWTFHQFLKGVHQNFLGDAPTYEIDFNTLYEQLKKVSTQISAGAAYVRDDIDRIETDLALVSRKLRLGDRAVPPSLVRRFFQKIRTEDEKIVYNLLRFYFSQPELDEDLGDKIDFLATVAAMHPGREAVVARPRADVVRIFEAVVSSCSWPSTGNDEANALVAAMDKLAEDVSRARSFEELTTNKLMENARTIKRRLGHALANPEVLASVAICNVRTKAIFRRRLDEEKGRIQEAGERIASLEQEFARTGRKDVPDEFRRFRDNHDEFQRLSEESNLRSGHVLAVMHSISEVLGKFDLGEIDLEEIDDALEIAEAGPDEASEPPDGLKHALQKILAAVEMSDGGFKEISNLGLEPWEIRSAKAAIARGGHPASERDALLLEGAALRGKAEEEASRWIQTKRMGNPLGALRQDAEETLSLAGATDHKFADLIRDAGDGSMPEEMGSLVRSRFRLLRAYSSLWLLHDAEKR